MVVLPTSTLRRFNSVASAASLLLPAGNGTVPITGTTTITSITAGYQGQHLTLEFASAGLKVTNGSNLKLRGDFLSCAVLDTLTLECDGTNWIEVCRAMTPPRCSVQNANTQVIASATPSVLLYQTENVDNASLHDTGANTGRITLPIAGLWIYGGFLLWPSGIAAGARFQTLLRLNGATTLIVVEYSVPVAGTFMGQNPGGVGSRAAGDYLELVAYQDSGGNQTIGIANTQFWAAWMGPA